MQSEEVLAYAAVATDLAIRENSRRVLAYLRFCACCWEAAHPEQLLAIWQESSRSHPGLWLSSKQASRKDLITLACQRSSAKRRAESHPQGHGRTPPGEGGRGLAVRNYLGSLRHFGMRSLLSKPGQGPLSRATGRGRDPMWESIGFFSTAWYETPTFPSLGTVCPYAAPCNSFLHGGGACARSAAGGRGWRSIPPHPSPLELPGFVRFVRICARIVAWLFARVCRDLLGLARIC